MQTQTPPQQSTLPGVTHAGWKAAFVLVLVCTAMAALLARLVWLQIMQTSYYKAKAVDNSTRVTFLRAPRGIIYDRRGNMLATNKQTLSLVAIPAQINVDNLEELALRLRKLLPEVKFEEIKSRLNAARESESVLPVVIERDVDVRVVSKFYEQKIWLPGIDILPDISRNYPYGELTAHVLGYCGEITEGQLKRRPERRMGDVVGQDGLERIYDDQLRGVDGEQRVRVNASGNTLSAETARPVITSEAKAGLPVVTSIDIELQRIAYDALGERRGAVVIVDPQTGEVLAMVSRPSFDPNAFTRRITPAVWKRLNAPDHPLYNRALSGFPPGSIWKAITLLAALDVKAVKPDTKLHVSGGIALGGFFFHDWTAASGTFDLVKCLAWSRDSAFYQMALKMKPEDIKKWGMLFGAGRPTGIELLHEGIGLLPDSKWKERVYKEKWYPGNTLHYSIGQTYCQVTPAQAARIYAGLGMKGQVPNLHFAIKIGDRQIPPPRPERIKVKKEYMEVVSKGLKAVVASGTGGATRLGSVEVAGKTGTAEAPPIGSKCHAWFCCYAPADKPRIAMCCFVEHGGHGGSDAAPIARKVLDRFFNLANPATQLAAAPKPKPKKRGR
jgi:penicillin-binding protein 2